MSLLDEEFKTYLVALNKSLHGIESELSDWVAKSHKRYMDAKSLWGKDADDGELRTAREALSTTKAEIAIVEKVINKFKEIYGLKELST